MLAGLWLDEIIRIALAEDIGSGDVTTECLVPEGVSAEAVIYSKERGVLAGLDVAERVFQVLEPGIRMERLLADGDLLEPRRPIAKVSGAARALLTGERVALNFLQRLSGIATATRRLAELLEGTGARLVDTRKTTPGLRLLEKYAVRVGGGYNHRIGLYDGILIKDNHIRVAGGIAEAVRKARSSAPHTLRIEVEVEDLGQLEEAVRAGADAVLLDNMPVEMIREAVRRYKGRVLLEASGGITSRNIREIAEAGVDLISVGAITHSAPALDISMDIGGMKPGAGERCCGDAKG